MIDLLVLAISLIGNIGLGAAVYLDQRRSKISQSFLASCLAISGWIWANYLIDHGPTFEVKAISAHLVHPLSINILVFLLLFGYYFQRKLQIRRFYKYILLGLYVAVNILTLTPIVLMGITPHQDSTDLVVGPGYPIYLAILLVLFIALTVELIYVRRHADGQQKVQTNYILVGLTVSISLALLTNAIIPLLLNSWAISKIGPLTTLFFVGLVSYAIIKHRLFDIRFVVARLAAYAMVVFVLGIGYGVFVFQVIDNLFLFSHASPLQRTVYTLSAVFMAFTFQPLKNLFDRISDHIFYKEHYRTADVVAQVTSTIASTLDIDRLSTEILTIVSRTIHAKRGAILVEHNGKFESLSENDYSDKEIPDEHLSQILQSNQLVLSDMSQNPLHSKLAKNGIAAALPFQTNTGVRGLLLLGEKQSGDLYTNQDIQLLEILGPELAVAIENARSYQQVRDFNRTLQTKVERATEELRQVNEQLERKNHQLEQLDKLKDEFISVTSHELRTPLTAIRGYLWMVMNNRKDAGKKEYLDRAYISTERLIDLVNDTLDISRMESGRVQLNPQPTKLPDIAKLVVQELASKAEERHQKLTVKHTSNIPAALCDPDKIHQVLTNLIGNALKFTPEKGSITVHFYTEKDHVVTAVSDTGPGISSQDQKRLFQKFMRLEPTANQPGTGLGLYLCHRVITLSKGKIWVDSQPGEGSTFFFSLPVSRDQPSILPIERKAFVRS